MNNKIQILSDFLANQIAAGEVVQRPESVVKELIENSLDAGANVIAIMIEEAGKTLIHITDNGSGMSKEDLQLAPVRHATSKIQSVSDLNEIKTFGFRGEAIPSIASISLLEIRSKSNTSKDDFGWRLTSEPLKELLLEQIAMDYGTQIIVKNLFYNTPARRKFLKTNLTEQKYIHETIVKFAVSHPSVRFIFYDNNELIFDIFPQSLKERIETLLKPNLNTESTLDLLEVNYSINDIHIYGYIGHPQIARKTNYVQYFFLNSRTINSKNLSFAVFSAFEHLLEKTLKPFFIINIDLDYKAVDVNVHPQKHEVKFEDEKLIFSLIKKAVQDALSLNNFLPDLNTSALNSTFLNSSAFEVNGDYIVNKTTGEMHSQNDFQNLKYVNLVGNRKDNISTGRQYSWNKDITEKAHSSVNLLYSNRLTEVSPYTSKLDVAYSLESEEHFALPQAEFLTASSLWQLHNKYILMQTETGVLAIDQHNAHERILYENFLSQKEAQATVKQNLLFPVECNVDNLQLMLVKELQSELNSMGFEFEIEDAQGNHKLHIISQPGNINIGAVEVSLLEILDDYITNEELKQKTNQERIVATVACKAAIKAGQRLLPEEMQSLVSRFLKCKMHYVCPHGRPIIVFFPLKEWDKKFGRI